MPHAPASTRPHVVARASCACRRRVHRRRHRPSGARSAVHRRHGRQMDQARERLHRLPRRLELLHRRHVAIPAVQSAGDGLSGGRERAVQRCAPADCRFPRRSCIGFRRSSESLRVVDLPDLRASGCDGRASRVRGRRAVGLGLCGGGCPRDREHLVWSRMGHTALSSHFLLLWVLALHFESLRRGRAKIARARVRAGTHAARELRISSRWCSRSRSRRCWRSGSAASSPLRDVRNAAWVLPDRSRWA